MSRPQKIHKPLMGGFANILKAVADGSGVPKKGNVKLPANKRSALPRKKP
jgi:hypothetical protein